LIADDFQLDQVADTGLARQSAGAYGVFNRIATSRVGQDLIFLRIDIVEQVSLFGSVILTRRTATVTISAPLSSIAARVSAKSRYLPVPTIRRDL